MRKLIYLACLITLFSFGTVCYSKQKKTKDWKIDSPLKALVTYFPSPAILRCLHHSEISKKPRKVLILRKAKFLSGHEIEQRIQILPRNSLKAKKRFSFTGTIKTKSNPMLIMQSGEITLGLQDQKFNLGLFGLEEFLGLQGKVQIKDKIGNQKIDYETFLKSTKGKIGNQKYNLELNGQDSIVNKNFVYKLTGFGMLGKYNLSVDAKSLGNDSYEIVEKYGPVMIFTTVTIND